MREKLLRFDWAIKKILRNKVNFGILEGFLSELLRQDITIIEILESESNKKNRFDKFNRVDLIVKIKDEERVLIEIQVASEWDFLSRLLFGVSTTIIETLAEGDPYCNIKKVYSIGVLFFNLGIGKDYVYHGTSHFIGIHENDVLELNEKEKELYEKERICDIFPEFYLIRVNQFKGKAKDTLDEWIYFLKNEEIKEEFHAKGLLEAKEKLLEMKLSEVERKEYKRFKEELHYEASMAASTFGLGEKEGIKRGRAEGRKIGREEGEKIGREEGEKIGKEEGKKIGKEEGEKLKAIEIAKNLISLGYEDTIIIQVTGLPILKISELKVDYCETK